MTAATAIANDPAAAPRSVTGARLVVEALEREGVTTVFGYPGGAIMPVYDALPGSKLTHILVRHEQAAAFAADGWARITGEVGVCIATSGPGATNLVTGIANAFLDCVPMVAITGQTASPLLGTDAFQETDIFGVTLPIVKHSYLVRDAADIPAVFAEAFELARSGRPGPVLIDLPKDVAQACVAASSPFPAVESGYAPGRASVHPEPVDADLIANAEAMIGAAKRPVLYFGGGVAIANAEDALRAFFQRTGIPAVATLKGLGALPTGWPGYLGMLGMHGARAANMAVDGCDLLICVGARFDDRATGRLNSFAPNARVIHIDGDPAEISKLRHADLAMAGDVRAILEALDPDTAGIGDWRAECAREAVRWAMRYDAPGSGVYAPALLKALSEAAGDRFVAACDVGQHQMWVAQHCRFSRARAHLTSGGLGAMGYGVPAGMAAAMADPEANVFVVTGDGSIMMNIQELATIRRYRIPVKIVLLDNSQLGMVRQWQELFYAENFSEVDLSDNPDFAELARVFGLEAFTVDRRDEVAGAVERLVAAKGPILCHVRIDPRENVWPLVPPGKSNAEMMEP